MPRVVRCLFFDPSNVSVFQCINRCVRTWVFARQVRRKAEAKLDAAAADGRDLLLNYVIERCTTPCDTSQRWTLLSPLEGELRSMCPPCRPSARSLQRLSLFKSWLSRNRQGR